MLQTVFCYNTVDATNDHVHRACTAGFVLVLWLVREPYLDKAMLHSTFLVAKHAVAPMNLVAVDTCTGARLYSFLSVAWGIIADVDSESERFRSLGNARFHVGAAIRIAS